MWETTAVGWREPRLPSVAYALARSSGVTPSDPPPIVICGSRGIGDSTPIAWASAATRSTPTSNPRRTKAVLTDARVADASETASYERRS
jgi:hypothetical protein